MAVIYRRRYENYTLRHVSTLLYILKQVFFSLKHLFHVYTILGKQDKPKITVHRSWK